MLRELRAFFASSLIDLSSSSHDGWFSSESVPLKWNYPLGLLYDLYAGMDPAARAGGSGDKERSKLWRESDPEEQNGPFLPWLLTVHFSDYPQQDLVRLDQEGLVMHDAFINSVKEADFLRNGTAKGIMSLSKEDSSGLWKSVEKGEKSFPFFFFFFPQTAKDH